MAFQTLALPCKLLPQPGCPPPLSVWPPSLPANCPLALRGGGLLTHSTDSKRGRAVQDRDPDLQCCFLCVWSLPIPPPPPTHTPFESQVLRATLSQKPPLHSVTHHLAWSGSFVQRPGRMMGRASSDCFLLRLLILLPGLDH